MVLINKHPLYPALYTVNLGFAGITLFFSCFYVPTSWTPKIYIGKLDESNKENVFGAIPIPYRLNSETDPLL